MTGQEMTSDLSIAVLLAWLKSDHIPGAPVRSTCTSAVLSCSERVLEVVGGADHLVRVATGTRLDDCRAAVLGDRHAPARGGTTVVTDGSASSLRTTSATTASKDGSPALCVEECTTTISP